MKDLLSVANPMVSDLLDPLAVVRHELPGLDRPIERASLCASIAAIHTAFVSRRNARSCWIGAACRVPVGLPSRISPLLIYGRDSGICNRENFVFLEKLPA
jgi:hypothetical protein